MNALGVGKIRFGLRAMLLSAAVALPGVAWSAPPTTQESAAGLSENASRFQHVHRMILKPDRDSEKDRITLQDKLVLPFSTRETCTKCHSYDTVQKGWHFNAPDPNSPAGRPGQPWVLTDVGTGTQLPLSYRKWPGTYRPDEVGMSPWAFVGRFARHSPGGGPGDQFRFQMPDPSARWGVSGKLEINCLACHSAEPGYDHTQYLVQIAMGNLMWAATATSGLGTVKNASNAMPETYDPFMGPDSEALTRIAPTVEWDKSRFDAGNNVVLNLTASPPNARCYFCHSSHPVGKEAPRKWMIDEDVHVGAGMKCVACHRNDLEHRISRNYEGEVLDRGPRDPLEQAALAGLTCRGCHLGEAPPAGGPGTMGGRLGAPAPGHVGLPAVHLERVSCTACHSGPAPAARPRRVQTSLAHALEFHGAHRGDDAAPYIQEPVFLRQPNGQIAPHRMVWPSFWGTLLDGKVTPLLPEAVWRHVREALNPQGDTGPVTPDRIRNGLEALQKTVKQGEPVYVTGGRLFRLGGPTLGEDHPSARPYAWPIGHDVRPARQALGADQRCTDCHAVNSGFLFGEVTPEGIFNLQEPRPLPMTALADLDADYHRAFALSFQARPLLKATLLSAAAVIAAVLLLYGLMGLGCLLKAAPKR